MRIDCPSPSAKPRGLLHDLRNDIGAVVGLARILASGKLGSLNEEQQELVNGIVARVQTIGARLRTPPNADAPGRPEATAKFTSATLSDTITSGNDTASCARQPPTENTETSASPVVGELIADTYRVVSAIGQGGMGSVFLARDEQLHRDVALKLIQLEPSHTAEGLREQFMLEARAMARVHHPNVVNIFALGEHRRIPFFAMEYVPGTTLKKQIDARGSRMGLDEVLGILDQACSGVAAIHLAGTVHRDIKPSNILIGPASRVAIADFGLAQHSDNGGAAFPGGTPGYIAPEVIRGDSSAFPERIDVYALGAVAYELLSGAPAHYATDGLALMQLQLTEDIVPPSRRRKGLPPAFDEVVMRALARDPGKRTPSVEQFRSELGDARRALSRSYENTDVVVVDDDDDMRRLLGAIIAEALPGANVSLFASGKDALAACIAKPPAIAIIDLQMPGMNGVELTAALRASPETQRIGIVVVTGVGSARDWQLLQQIGANAFQVKPVEPAALTALVRTLVPHSQR